MWEVSLNGVVGRVRCVSAARTRCLAVLVVLSLVMVATPVMATGGVTFVDVATAENVGLTYARVPSSTIAIFDQLTQLPVLTFNELPLSPNKPHGAPGVAMLDYDGDGDLDLYVTNGPGQANSLFANQLAQTGALTFVDRATEAGLDATDQDSAGVCFGDIDNDRDADLMVVSMFGGHRLFENQGDGTFADITTSSGVSALDGSAVGCSFGDIDNDGLLDVAIANNTVDPSSSFAIITPFAFNRHNDLLRNVGGNVFEDVSETSGLRATAGFFPPGAEGSPTMTWAIAIVDIDGDGDGDIVHADDQGGVPFARYGGIDRGLLHVFLNDGTGHFTSATAAAGLAQPGGWMGLAFGDLDADGNLDLFSTNLGDWAQTLNSPLDPQYGAFAVYEQNDLASRWFLGAGGGGFVDPGLGPVVASPFGWGACMADYDNDGDTDILYHGGLYFGPVLQTAPAALLRNDGTGMMDRDADAFATSTDHELRGVHGVAMGDLDGNGFVDVVSVANFDIPADGPIAPYNHQWGSPFDGGHYAQLFIPTGDGSGDSVFSGVELLHGSLSVELNTGSNGNRSITVGTVGAVGLTPGGSVNRDGIGARVSVRPWGGKSQMRLVLGGASHASQDSLEGVFGLGRQRGATVEVSWPGGVRNRLYYARAGERLTMPEIPCRFDDPSVGLGSYLSCVAGSLHDLRGADVVTHRESSRLFISALLAYFRG